MKQLFRNSTHTQSRSHDCLISEIKGKKIKVTYEAYNAVERCMQKFFDGDKWNHILSMLDIGIEPNNSAYNIWDEKNVKIGLMNYSKKLKLCATAFFNCC